MEGVIPNHYTHESGNCVVSVQRNNGSLIGVVVKTKACVICMARQADWDKAIKDWSIVTPYRPNGVEVGNRFADTFTMHAYRDFIRRGRPGRNSR